MKDTDQTRLPAPYLASPRRLGYASWKGRRITTLRNWGTLFMLSIRRKVVKTCLVVAASASTALFAETICTPPPSYQAQLKAHADSETYVAVGNWFGDHRQYECAADAFRAALKL